MTVDERLAEIDGRLARVEARVLPWTPARIRALRERLGLTQAQFAARLGTTRNTVARWTMAAPVMTPSADACLRLLALERGE